jgi:hypothetical protein
MIKYDENEVLKVCQESDSMAKAASKLNIHMNTFRRIAKKIGCYKPNQAGKGIKKTTKSIPLSDILEGLHPDYQTFKLKNRLFKESIKSNKCELCGIDKWMGESLKCELDHIDGDSRNHDILNLRILCPNCHSQTETFRAKNIKK